MEVVAVGVVLKRLYSKLIDSVNFLESEYAIFTLSYIFYVTLSRITGRKFPHMEDDKHLEREGKQLWEMDNEH